MNLGAYPMMLGGGIEVSEKKSSSRAKQSQKARLSLIAALLWISVQTNLNFTMSASLWAETSSNMQVTFTRFADLTTSKCLWNSTIYTAGANYMCLDVNIFCPVHPNVIF
jgi:hypothetical protein